MAAQGSIVAPLGSFDVNQLCVEFKSSANKPSAKSPPRVNDYRALENATLSTESLEFVPALGDVLSGEPHCNLVPLLILGL